MPDQHVMHVVYSILGDNGWAKFGDGTVGAVLHRHVSGLESVYPGMHRRHIWAQTPGTFG
jgi:hypothetical protein